MPVIAVFKFPRIVLIQVKQSIFVLFFLPTIFRAWTQSACTTAVKQERPSDTTWVPGTSLCLAHCFISCWLNAFTAENTAYIGCFLLFVWTAATKGVLFSEPRPLLPPSYSPPRYNSSDSIFYYLVFGFGPLFAGRSNRSNFSSKRSKNDTYPSGRPLTE